jgi:hypothetical protein
MILLVQKLFIWGLKMQFEVYKILHILGLLMIFSSLGGVYVYVANGGTKASNNLRKKIAMFHGIGGLLVLVSGFGMLAKLGIIGMPLWVILKLIIWVSIGALLFIGYRSPSNAYQLWVLTIALGTLAAILAIYKI